MIDFVMNLVNNIKDYGLERVFRRYYSIYRAQVTSTEDDQHRGRIKVKIPSIFGDETLPSFAEPRDFRGAGPSKGEFVVPDVDDWVFIEFEMGDSRFPVYSGGWHAEDELDETEFAYADDDTPTTKGFQNKYGQVFKFVEEDGKEKVYLSTPAGHFFILDDTEGAEQVHLIHKTGARLIMDEDGSFNLQAANGAFISMDADQDSLSVTSSQGATVALDDDITIMDSTGASILNLTSDGAQLTATGDIVESGNTWTMNVGAAKINAAGAQINLGSGQVALGAGPTELIDQVIQALNALLTAPTLVTTGVGPSGPLTPPASITLTQVMVLLTVIKGSLS